MSGFEVAGLVLGTLPLAIQALQRYRGAVSAWRLIDRDIKNIAQDLETERLTLQNTCEIMLDGIAPPSMILPMIEDPFGSEWKSLGSKIRGRFWTSNEKFEEEVEKMKDAVEGLKDMLKIDSTGNVRLLDRGSLMQELRRRTGPLLRKNDYKDVLARIRRGNEVLQTLTKQRSQLEPSRQRRSQWRLTQIIRRVSQGIFNALQRSVTCRCPEPHGLGLELQPREAVVLDCDQDGEVAAKLDFRVTLGSRLSDPLNVACSGMVTRGISQLEATSCQKWKWNHIKIQMMCDPETSNPRLNGTNMASSHRRYTSSLLPSIPSPCPSTSQSLGPSPDSMAQRREGKRVRFSSLFSSSTNVSSQATTSGTSTEILVVPQTTSTLSTVAHQLAPPKLLVEDLCSTICTAASLIPSGECCGYVIDNLGEEEARFGLYPLLPTADHYSAIHPLGVAGMHSPAANPPFTTLSKRLETTQLDFAEVLPISLALTTGAIHLYHTPWLNDRISGDDILLFPDFDSEDKAARPFLLKNLPKTDDSSSITANQGKERVNTILLSLGVLLVNLVVSESQLKMVQAPGINGVLSTCQEASRQLGKVLVYGSNNYAAATKWCLDNVIGRVDSFDHNSFCHAFYLNVIAPLEEDADVLFGTKDIFVAHS